MKIRDTSPRQERVGPEIVASAFGTKPSASTKGFDLFEVREAMTRLLRSSGGRPSLVGANSQVKIPKIEADWEKLAQLAMASADLAHKPSTGQMAAMVLHLALDKLPFGEIQEAVRKEFA
ncbi:MAG: hypothetical protein WCA85_32845 [Paraburkholderia sp.]|uniref:hypothetical protein n=1 Tax=Paraburkholderia sp. TaxID=1926495 RepID=UPI003C5FAC09